MGKHKNNLWDQRDTAAKALAVHVTDLGVQTLALHMVPQAILGVITEPIVISEHKWLWPSCPLPLPIKVLFVISIMHIVVSCLFSLAHTFFHCPTFC